MKILIAEDDDVSRLLLSSFLQPPSSSHMVVETRSAEEAWKVIHSTNDLDLCIFDVVLPDQTGLDLLSRLRQWSPYAKLPVILCTALNDRVTVTRAAGLGVSQYLVKPFTRDSVLEKIERALKLGGVTTPLEDEDSARARLQVDKRTYDALLVRLVQGVTDFLAESRRMTRWMEVRPLAVRANALKGASLNMGALALAAQLTAAETHFVDQISLAEAARRSADLIEPNAFADLTAAVDRVASELQRVQDARDSRPEKSAPAKS